MKTKGIPTGKRKTFVNTTLGETWEEAKMGEKRPDAEADGEGKHYSRRRFLTGGLSDGRYRLAAETVLRCMSGDGLRERKPFWWIKSSLWGVPDEEETLLRVDAAINKNTAMQTEPK